jgi:hypothetical protein
MEKSEISSILSYPDDPFAGWGASLKKSVCLRECKREHHRRPHAGVVYPVVLYILDLHLLKKTTTNN